MKQLKITDEIIANAKRIIDTSHSEAAGYRVKVYCLPADQELEGDDKEKHPTLAAAGFQSKTNKQLERETRGSDRGVVVHVGKGAWKGNHLMKSGDWAVVGQVVLYQNYTGKTDEEPKGSGEMYRFLNDEDVIAFFRENVTGEEVLEEISPEPAQTLFKNNILTDYIKKEGAAWHPDDPSCEPVEDELYKAQLEAYLQDNNLTFEESGHCSRPHLFEEVSHA